MVLGSRAKGYVSVVFELLSVSDILQLVREALSVSDELGQQCAGNANFHT